MNCKDRRKDESVRRRKLRVIAGGKVDRAVLAKAVSGHGSDGQPPAKRLAEALAMLLAVWEEHEQHLDESLRCSDGDKFAVLMNLAANFGIRIEVPYDQFLDAAGVAYEQQEEQLGRR